MVAGLFRLARGVIVTGLVLLGLLLTLVAANQQGATERAAVSQPRTSVEDMTCGEVRGILDAANSDKSRMRAIIDATDRIYAALDAERAGAGRSRIYARMSADGRLTTQAMATARCERHPAETLRQAAVAVYEGRESLGRSLGLDD